MTNEELAILAKTDPDAQMKLWKQTEQFAHKVINRYRGFLQRNLAFDYSDLEQIAFLGFQDAVMRFDEGRGYFMCIMEMRIVAHIRRALGIERKKTVENAAFMVSLDAPLLEEETFNLHDVVADPDALDPGEEAILSTMCQDIRAAVNRLPERQRAAINEHYFEGKSGREIAELFGVTKSAAGQLLKRGRLRLERDSVIQGYLPNYHRSKGIRAFLSDWTSSVEAEVLQKMDWENRNAALVQTLTDAIRREKASVE